MPRLLLINPNTSAFMTALLARHARAELPADMEIVATTGAFGSAVIAGEAAYAIASHAALDAYANCPGPWNAILLACFGDPGLHALREMSGVPVVSFADAAMDEAVRLAGAGGRFAVVTGGLGWEAILTRLAAGLGHAAAFAGVAGIGLDGEAIARDPDHALALLRAAVIRVTSEQAADVVIIAGAGLAGLASRLQPDSPVPLLDSVLAGIRTAGALAQVTPGNVRPGCAAF